VEEQEGISQEKVNLDYGECFHCLRIIPMSYLIQVRFYSGHKTKGNYHHKLICQNCKKASDEILTAVNDAEFG